ncbi:hypothetical protein AB1N83_012382 [Pleurotus pulmonarius]
MLSDKGLGRQPTHQLALSLTCILFGSLIMFWNRLRCGFLQFDTLAFSEVPNRITESRTDFHDILRWTYVQALPHYKTPRTRSTESAAPALTKVLNYISEFSDNYPSKELASKAACTWAKIDDPNKLVLYTSRVGPYKGWVVGVGITRPSGTIEDIVRVDSDDKTGAATKGIHFNAKNSKDSSQTLAAVIEPTKALTPAARDKQYQKILESIKGQEPRMRRRRQLELATFPCLSNGVLWSDGLDVKTVLDTELIAKR